MSVLPGDRVFGYEQGGYLNPVLHASRVKEAPMRRFPILVCGNRNTARVDHRGRGHLACLNLERQPHTRETKGERSVGRTGDEGLEKYLEDP